MSRLLMNLFVFFFYLSPSFVYSFPPSRIKKQVVFADTKGKSLTEVRIMSEPSNVPPLWSIEFLSHVTQGFISPELTEEWTIRFRQPASDYLNFRQKLDAQNVSLENVIVKESDSMVVGTVKVKNIGFHKEVIMRSSWNNWKTEQDTFCVYSPVWYSCLILVRTRKKNIRFIITIIHFLDWRWKRCICVV